MALALIRGKQIRDGTITREKLHPSVQCGSSGESWASYEFLATAGQTVVENAAFNPVNKFVVHKNGLLLQASEYDTTVAGEITMASPLLEGETVHVCTTGSGCTPLLTEDGLELTTEDGIPICIEDESEESGSCSGSTLDNFTRAELNAAAIAGTLLPFTMYYISDEDKVAVASSASSYFVLMNEPVCEPLTTEDGVALTTEDNATLCTI